MSNLAGLHLFVPDKKSLLCVSLLLLNGSLRTLMPSLPQFSLRRSCIHHVSFPLIPMRSLCPPLGQRFVSLLLQPSIALGHDLSHGERVSPISPSHLQGSLRTSLAVPTAAKNVSHSCTFCGCTSQAPNRAHCALDQTLSHSNALSVPDHLDSVHQPSQVGHALHLSSSQTVHPVAYPEPEAAFAASPMALARRSPQTSRSACLTAICPRLHPCPLTIGVTSASGSSSLGCSRTIVSCCSRRAWLEESTVQGKDGAVLRVFTATNHEVDGAKLSSLSVQLLPVANSRKCGLLSLAWGGFGLSLRTSLRGSHGSSIKPSNLHDLNVRACSTWQICLLEHRCGVARDR